MDGAFTCSTLELETIIEMSRTVQICMDRATEVGLDFENFDSRQLITVLPEWAKEFDSAYPPEKWNDDVDPHQRYLGGYYSAIDDFVIGKLQSGCLSPYVQPRVPVPAAL